MGKLFPGQVSIKKRYGKVILVSGQLSDKLSAANPEIAIAFLSRYQHFFGINNPQKNLRTTACATDQLGMTHITFQQVYHGIPVDYNQLKVHFSADNVITSVHGNYLNDLGDASIGTQPSLSKESAIVVARLALQDPSAECHGVELVIFPYQDRFYLAYRFILRGDHPHSKAWQIYVDADTGTILDKYPAGPTAG
ncbi:MAG: hypothetical protein FH749_13545 [Firmicutes bacterium]|nr:hypothetical protein [Bacillota bacterium]